MNKNVKETLEKRSKAIKFWHNLNLYRIFLP